MNQIYTLAQVNHLSKQASDSPFTSVQFSKYLSTALRHYVLPTVLKVEDVIAASDFEKISGQVSIIDLKDMVSIFDRCSQSDISANKISQGTINNYKSALGRFNSWVMKQIWWQELCTDEISSVAPYRPQVPDKPTSEKFDSYGLQTIPPELQKELDSYGEFRLSGGKNLRSHRRREQRLKGGTITTPKMEKIKENTLKKEIQAVSRFMGWYQTAYPDKSLDLSLLANPDLLEEYTYWMVTTRNVSYSTGVNMVGTGITVAKWSNYNTCQRRDWSDVPLIAQLQDLQGYYKEIYEKEKKVQQRQKWNQKELSHEEARQVVLYLYSLCAPNYGRHDCVSGEFLSHGQRQLSAVAREWQRYLIVKILVYCPVRQEEIRALDLGKTLFRRLDENNNPYYEVKITEHKREKLGIVRNYRLPAILTADLDVWFEKWRSMIFSAIESEESWSEFWGWKMQKVKALEERIANARQGIISPKVTVSIPEYIEREEKRLKVVLQRLHLREKTLANLKAHNYTFFLMTNPESFGKPHYVKSIWVMVTEAISLATVALFGEPRWTNPHALRHIAEKHIRLSGKGDIAESFGTLIGHSKEMGDQYAAQITTSYDLSQNIVDNWWLESE
ncbi:hypothetical protein [Geminocystis sp.]|uniref:hypothetical protein n=1 Tax=Geminocystis sp. TaxID=2664100 RepID=UPI00359365A3